ncbi:hypothetical protein NDU88_004190 [Pleurodeles waltl]|uniref:Uncharacterized protein n=1 Tax=Pleurodeles waltl TaxID=8319 RepID=A0AAV7T8W3_PLEWA|nr:hypothetical protein NDU88_004190 [Pleurodeles waltl]
MRATVSPLSIRVLMSSVTAMRAVSVLWLARNPDWEGSRRLLSSRNLVSCLLTVFSMTLAEKGRSEMGRKFFRSLGSAVGFFRRALTSACFQLSGKVADANELLMMVWRWGAMMSSALLKMKWGQGPEGGTGVDGVHGSFGLFRADVGPGVEGDGWGSGFCGGWLGLRTEAVVKVGDLSMEEGSEGVAEILRGRDGVGDGVRIGELFDDVEEFFAVVSVLVQSVFEGCSLGGVDQLMVFAGGVFEGRHVFYGVVFAPGFLKGTAVFLGFLEGVCEPLRFLGVGLSWEASEGCKVVRAVGDPMCEAEGCIVGVCGDGGFAVAES